MKRDTSVKPLDTLVLLASLSMRNIITGDVVSIKIGMKKVFEL